jgi:hypothetical protein
VGLDDSKVLVLLAPATDKGAETYAAELATSIARGLGDGGFSPESLPMPEGEESSAVVRAAAGHGARWVVVASCALVDEKLVWRAVAWDGRDGGIVGADSYSSYPGLAALPLIEQSASNVVTAMALSRKAADRLEPVMEAVTFLSPDEGAELFIGLVKAGDRGEAIDSEGSVPMGKVSEGAVKGPYLPFLPGQKVLVTLIKEGFWPQTLSVEIKEGEAVKLPPLTRKLDAAFGLDYGYGRLLGVEAWYRWYLLPDRLYAAVADAPWVAYDFRPASWPVLHDELRFSMGLDPFFKPAARLRFRLEVGLAGVFTLVTSPGYTEPFAFDLLLQPFGIGLEWHSATWAAVLDIRTYFSLGLGSGVLARDWVSIGENHAPFVYFGVMRK